MSIKLKVFDYISIRNTIEIKRTFKNLADIKVLNAGAKTLDNKAIMITDIDYRSG
jgi:hypothetical protein